MFSHELAELIFPTRCIACGVLGISICSDCRSGWNPHIYRRVVGSFYSYSSIPYSTIAQKVILASKENSLKEADRLVVEALEKSLFYFYRERGRAPLVPIPARKGSLRRRGRDYILELTKLMNVESIQLLSVTRSVRDQSALPHHKRGENVHHAFKAIHCDVGEVILIDDIVTSGATLLEAQRALQRRGVAVKGAITACMA